MWVDKGKYGIDIHGLDQQALASIQDGLVKKMEAGNLNGSGYTTLVQVTAYRDHHGNPPPSVQVRVCNKPGGIDIQGLNRHALEEIEDGLVRLMERGDISGTGYTALLAISAYLDPLRKKNREQQKAKGKKSRPRLTR